MSIDIKQLTDDARIVEVILYVENTALPLDRICALTKLSEEDAIDALR
jgi:chromosome segregation and condensation protein ScpB